MLLSEELCLSAEASIDLGYLPVGSTLNAPTRTRISQADEELEPTIMLEAVGLSCSDFFYAMMAHQYNRAFAMVASAVMRFLASPY